MCIPETVVCRGEPTLTRCGGLNLIIFVRDPVLTALMADEMKATTEYVQQRFAELTEKKADLEWKLPSDPESRVIEFRGRPLRYSKIRFKILKALILANGEPISYSVASQVGWGANIDKEVLEDTIYQFNRFFKMNGIPKFIRCDNEFLSMKNRNSSGVKKKSSGRSAAKHKKGGKTDSQGKVSPEK